MRVDTGKIWDRIAHGSTCVGVSSMLAHRPWLGAPSVSMPALTHCTLLCARVRKITCGAEDRSSTWRWPGRCARGTRACWRRRCSSRRILSRVCARGGVMRGTPHVDALLCAHGNLDSGCAKAAQCVCTSEPSSMLTSTPIAGPKCAHSNLARQHLHARTHAQAYTEYTNRRCPRGRSA